MQFCLVPDIERVKLVFSFLDASAITDGVGNTNDAADALLTQVAADD